MIPRDPVAELWMRRPRGASSRSLTIPVKRPIDGSLAWLSVGQFLTLMWLRRRMRYNRGETTLATIAAATDTHPGAVTHRLDRLAQLGLIGRRSTVGRGHRTTFWPGRSSSAGSVHRGDCTRHTHARHPAAGGAVVNVATSTPSGGLIRAYVSRGGLIRDAARGGSPPGPPGGGTNPRPGRRRPPRLIFEHCPRDGGAARLVAWRFRLSSSRMVALWDGPCPRCGSIVIAPLVIDLAADSWRIPSAGDVLAVAAPLFLTGDGRPHPRSVPPAIPPGPRLERIRELAAEVITRGEVDADEAGRLGARWLGWRPERIPQPPVIAVDPAELEAARSAAWSAVRDWRPVRYSQPTSSAGEPDSLVRDSQPPAGDVDV